MCTYTLLVLNRFPDKGDCFELTNGYLLLLSVCHCRRLVLGTTLRTGVVDFKYAKMAFISSSVIWLYPFTGIGGIRGRPVKSLINAFAKAVDKLCFGPASDAGSIGCNVSSIRLPHGPIHAVSSTVAAIPFATCLGVTAGSNAGTGEPANLRSGSSTGPCAVIFLGV